MRCLIFDLDDTLYPERDYVLSGFRAVDRWLQERGLAQGFGALAETLFLEGRRGRIFDEVLDRLGVPDPARWVPELVEVYRNHQPTLRLFDDAEWALQHFRAGRKLGLITDGYLVTQQKKVAALGLASRMDHVICTDMLGRADWKPSPRSFEMMMQQLGGEAAEYAYVGDNPAKDFLAPNRMGWASVRVRRPGTEHALAEAAPDAAAQFEVSGLRGLADLFPH